MSSKMNLHPIIRLAVMSEDSDSNSQFGRGIANLCLGVREKGSLNAAAKSMKMAYSKAWKLMNSAEEQLGIQLIERDGARDSTLTPEAMQLVTVFDKVCAELSDFADEQFKKEFAKLS